MEQTVNCSKKRRYVGRKMYDTMMYVIYIGWKYLIKCKSNIWYGCLFIKFTQNRKIACTNLLVTRFNFQLFNTKNNRLMSLI